MKPHGEGDGESPALDEVGVAVGPDRDSMGGLFDAPTTEGTHTATRERTDIRAGSSEPDHEGPPRRTAVLAWIAATPPPTGDVTIKLPCEPLKRRIADEPLDVLPALDGLPVTRPGVAAPIEREDTATQIEGFEAMVDRESAVSASVPAPRRAPWVLPAFAVAVAIAAFLLMMRLAVGGWRP